MSSKIEDHKTIGKIPTILGPDQSISDWHKEQAIIAHKDGRLNDWERHHLIMDMTATKIKEE